MKNYFFIFLIVALCVAVSFTVGAFVASDFVLPFLSACAISDDGSDIQPVIYPDFVGKDVWRLDCNTGSSYDVRLSDFYYHVGDNNNVALMDVIPEIPVNVTFQAVCTPLYKLSNGGYIGYPEPSDIKTTVVNTSFFVASGSYFNIGNYLPVSYTITSASENLVINDYLVSEAIIHFTPASDIYTLSAGDVVNGSVEFSQSSVYQGTVQDIFINFIPDNGYTAPANVTSPSLQVNNAKITNYVLNSDGSASAQLYDIKGNVTVDITYNLIPKVYPISYSLVGLIADSSNPKTISEAEDIAIKFTAESGYILPAESDITVVNANMFNYSISGNTATLGINNPTGPVYIVATGSRNYNVFYNLSHCSISPTDTSINTSTTRDYIITPYNNYGLSLDNLSVTGAVVTNKKLNSNGTLSFTVSQVASNVTISCTAEPIVFDVSYNLTYVSSDVDNPTFVTAGDSGTVFTFTADNGYTLPDSITVTNCTYNYNKTAGTVTVSNPTGNITFTIIGVAVSHGVDDYYLATGNYTFVSDLDFVDVVNYTFPFTSNDTDFIGMVSTSAGLFYTDTEGTNIKVYDNNNYTWVNDNYKSFSIFQSYVYASYVRLLNQDSNFLSTNLASGSVSYGTFYNLSVTVNNGRVDSYNNYILAGDSSVYYNVTYSCLSGYVPAVSASGTNCSVSATVTNATSGTFHISSVTGDVTINVTLLQHTNNLAWYFMPSPKALGPQNTSYSIGFTSAGTHFSILRNGTVLKEKFYLFYDDIEAYKSGWKNPDFRYIVFDTEPTGALLTYLEANAYHVS